MSKVVEELCMKLNIDTDEAMKKLEELHAKSKPPGSISVKSITIDIVGSMFCIEATDVEINL